MHFILCHASPSNFGISISHARNALRIKVMLQPSNNFRSNTPFRNRSGCEMSMEELTTSLAFVKQRSKKIKRLSPSTNLQSNTIRIFLQPTIRSGSHISTIFTTNPQPSTNTKFYSLSIKISQGCCFRRYINNRQSVAKPYHRMHSSQ